MSGESGMDFDKYGNVAKSELLIFISRIPHAEFMRVQIFHLTEC